MTLCFPLLLSYLSSCTAFCDSRQLPVRVTQSSVPNIKTFWLVHDGNRTFWMLQNLCTNLQSNFGLLCTEIERKIYKCTLENCNIWILCMHVRCDFVMLKFVCYITSVTYNISPYIAIATLKVIAAMTDLPIQSTVYVHCFVFCLLLILVWNNQSL